jgi:hypothetical protein
MLAKIEPLRIAYFIVDPGESEEALHKRCNDAVEWPDGNYRHIFESQEESACH